MYLWYQIPYILYHRCIYDIRYHTYGMIYHTYILYDIRYHTVISDVTSLSMESILVHPCCCSWQYFTPFMAEWYSIVWRSHLKPVICWRALVLFLCLDILSSAAVNIGYMYLFELAFSFFSGYIMSIGTLDYRGYKATSLLNLWTISWEIFQCKVVYHNFLVIFSSVQSLVVSNFLQPRESQPARPPCPSPTPGVYSNSCPSSRWCHPAISSSVVPFSSCPQSLLASGSFPMSQLFAWGGQSTGVSASASVLPMNTQDLSPLEWTGWISLQSKGLSRVFSNTTVQKHQFFGTQLSL